MGYTVNFAISCAFKCLIAHSSARTVFSAPRLRFQMNPSEFPVRTFLFEEKKLFISITLIEKLLNWFCPRSPVNVNSGQSHSHKILQPRVSEGTVALFPGEQPETQTAHRQPGPRDWAAPGSSLCSSTGAVPTAALGEAQLYCQAQSG